MTKRKEGAVRGRPKGSGEGLADVLSVRVSPELFAEIARLGDREGISPSEIARDLLQEAVTMRRRRDRGS
jgi:hypothetical protein